MNQRESKKAKAEQKRVIHSFYPLEKVSNHFLSSCMSDDAFIEMQKWRFLNFRLGLQNDLVNKGLGF